ncbi:hypothetical protein ASD24_24715 [Paenibacillus sp. Root52]|uniref:hypothetical protein n=1 Tax=Paenibacillus sp. Root52 TaxID=1736552 RepID=UPI0006F40B7B|nr:hypothetical protein [Paenibacillus sp. Root52]KQY91001.1 hypothetical protein ASD24_24715 [Paenibacillus sp. Root52]
MKNNKLQNKTERTLNLVPSPDDNVSASEPSMSKTTLIMTRVVGIITVGLSVSLFVQLIPFVFLFIAGYVGIQPTASLNNMNAMVWILSCVTIMLVTVYGFITWMKFIWRRLISQPKNILSLIQRRKKGAE